MDAHAEITSAAAVARFRTRSDVVRHRGRYALINENRTPYQAMVEDLMFLRSVLAGAGISYLLVRGNNHRPVVAVDWKDRKELRDALVEACRDEPFYSMSVDAKKKSSVLVADGELSPNRQSRIFRLYRPRVEPEGGFEFGASAGVQLELWSFEGDQLILPIENSLTRRTMLAQDAVRGTVERYGHTWPTIENMFADHASDISFDVDLVFSWVDGSSPEYIAARRAEPFLGRIPPYSSRAREPPPVVKRSGSMLTVPASRRGFCRHAPPRALRSLSTRMAMASSSTYRFNPSPRFAMPASACCSWNIRVTDALPAAPRKRVSRQRFLPHTTGRTTSLASTRRTSSATGARLVGEPLLNSPPVVRWRRWCSNRHLPASAHWFAPRAYRAGWW